MSDSLKHIKLFPEDEPTHEEKLMAEHWPDLPNWVLAQYSAKEWLWMPDHMRYKILSGKSVISSGLDYWNDDYED